MTDQIWLEPEALAFAEAANSPLLFTLGPEQGRLALDNVQSGTIRKPAVDVEDLTITDGKSAQVGLCILRPQNTQTPLPVIVYIDGAGWVFGSALTHDRNCRASTLGKRRAALLLKKRKKENIYGHFCLKTHPTQSEHHLRIWFLG